MKTGKVRRITPFCYSEYPWLTFSTQAGGLFCRYCALFAGEVGTSKLPAGQLVTKPCTRFSRLTGQNGYLYEHNRMEYHKQCLLKGSEFCLRMSKPELLVNSQLDSSLQRQKARNREILKSIAEVVVFCARTGSAYRAHRDDGRVPVPQTINDIVTGQGQFRSLLQLYSLANRPLHQHVTSAANNALYTSKTVQNELVSCMSSAIKSTLRDQINAAQFYSVLSDESTDAARMAQLSISVRYVHDSKITERFVDFLNPESLAGQGIATAILNSLDSLGLDINNLVGQGYDGAAAMSGEFRGVQSEIRKQCGDQAVYVHCAAHAFNLTLVKASEEPSIRNAFGVISSVANFFNSSSVRVARLETHLESLDNPPAKKRLKIPCQTRWVEKHEAVHTLFSLYSDVCALLSEMSTERGSTATDAHCLLASLTKPEFVVALAVLHSVMSVTKHLATYLQAANTDLFSAMRHVNAIASQLHHMREDEKQFEEVFSGAQTLYGEDNITVPRLAGRQTKRSNVPSSSPIEYFRPSLYLPFLDHVLSEIKHRFQTHKSLALSQCKLLPKLVISSSFDDVKEGINVYLHLLSGDIAEIGVEFEIWKRLCSSITDPPADCIAGLVLCDRSFYPNIYCLLSIFATIPVSTATPERTFSVLKHLKSYLRSTMSEDRLTGLALAYIHDDIDVTKTVEEIVSLFAQRQRRIPM